MRIQKDLRWWVCRQFAKLGVAKCGSRWETWKEKVNQHCNNYQRYLGLKSSSEYFFLSRAETEGRIGDPDLMMFFFVPPQKWLKGLVSRAWLVELSKCKLTWSKITSLNLSKWHIYRYCDHHSYPNICRYHNPNSYANHTSYLSREPRVYPCKFFLAGVNFYRFNAKNWQFNVYFAVITQKIGNFLCILS